MKGLFVILCCLFFLSDKARFQPSPNGHYLLRDGKAFFWLGDAFTVIQAAILAEFDGPHTANAYSDLPLLRRRNCYWFVTNLGRQGDKLCRNIIWILGGIRTGLGFDIG